ncbi:hypothetical protein I5Q34_26600 [Streptomyces sp. AV19]|uniref:HIT family protein n=1 Tax=Streptomyces sp. AV19 TaxID=2793068 RepID=UPI0018FE7D00|nr:hypothetical protein [Streptomyces sp. AV19]MBH1937800.1 hypothetical protein [Streptomyces sp. AV19]MDG4537076.1 hypothetical protein [Streptomyces sp. AV19]
MTAPALCEIEISEGDDGSMRPDCLFCRISHDGAPAAIVQEWTDALAIVPRSGGCADGHLLVLPRGHVADFTTDPVVSATARLQKMGHLEGAAAKGASVDVGDRVSYHDSYEDDAAMPPGGPLMGFDRCRPQRPGPHGLLTEQLGTY